MSRHGGRENTETSLEILQKRLARGEVTIEQYHEMKAVLEEELRSKPGREHHH